MGRVEQGLQGWFAEGLRRNEGLALACVVDISQGELGEGTQNLTIKLPLGITFDADLR